MPTPEETIARLEGQITELRSENAERRTANRDLKAENAKLKSDMTGLDARIKDFESKQGKPSELQLKIDDLTGQLRGLKHRGAFEKAAAEAKVKPKALDALWKSLELKADADEPDEAAIRAAIDGAKESHEFFFDAAEPEGDRKPPAPPRFGNDRGKEPPVARTPTPEQLRDPAFAMDRYREQQAAAGRPA